MIITTLLAMGLMATPALAGDAPTEPMKPAPVAEKAYTKLPRQTTLERWRGGSRLQRAARESLRSEALNKMLPPANRSFNGGASMAGF